MGGLRRLLRNGWSLLGKCGLTRCDYGLLIKGVSPWGVKIAVER